MRKMEIAASVANLLRGEMRRKWTHVWVGQSVVTAGALVQREGMERPRPRVVVAHAHAPEGLDLGDGGLDDACRQVVSHHPVDQVEAGEALGLCLRALGRLRRVVVRAELRHQLRSWGEVVGQSRGRGW